MQRYTDILLTIDPVAPPSRFVRIRVSVLVLVIEVDDRDPAQAGGDAQVGVHALRGRIDSGGKQSRTRIALNT